MYLLDRRLSKFDYQLPEAQDAKHDEVGPLPKACRLEHGLGTLAGISFTKATLGIACIGVSALLVFRTPTTQSLNSTHSTDPHVVPAAAWDALNLTVGGRLGKGIPFSRQCFKLVGPDVANGGASCADVQSNYHNSTFRASEFGAAMSTQWETCQRTNQGCLLNSTNPSNNSAFEPPKVCYQGSVAPYYISVQSAMDVIAAFEFSRFTGVPISIKNSGHDYVGRSIVPGTLSLWVKYETSFIPDGCTALDGVPVFTYGAGEDMESLISFADQNNVTFIGGSSPTVGAAGGWVQGGGHSSLSNQYGLGVDRVRQFRIVTPDGKLRVANECQNTDLFWALRGGGGGTFGVVMEVTSEVVPHPVSTVSLSWSMKYNSTNAQALMKILVDNAVQWSKDGWGGYCLLSGGILANPVLNYTESKLSLKPLMDFLNTTATQHVLQPYDSFSELFAAILKFPDAVGYNNALSSRLVPDTLFTENATELLGAITTAADLSHGNTSFFFTTPYSYNATTDSTSVTPAWRGAVWHVISSARWGWDASPETVKAKYEMLTEAMQPLRALTPNGGAYQNEADVYEPNASTSFWGTDNYDRLMVVKAKYDPHSLLDCWHCVGWKGRNTSAASCYLDLD
ncbi:hypothetical protein FRC07_009243 [Ceratobasidium sp. 392]|nr:hypothetical protein FRC07_009243 [Ceratobasidium sp. 392]